MHQFDSGAVHHFASVSPSRPYKYSGRKPQRKPPCPAASSIPSPAAAPHTRQSPEAHFPGGTSPGQAHFSPGDRRRDPNGKPEMKAASPASLSGRLAQTNTGPQAGQGSQAVTGGSLTG